MELEREDIENRKSGVFMIRNICNEKLYIGYISDLRRVKKDYFIALRKGVFTNSLLQDDFDKFGEEAFEHDVVEYCPVEKLAERKQYYINFYRNVNGNVLYNHDLEQRTWVKRGSGHARPKNKMVKVINIVKKQNANKDKKREILLANIKGSGGTNERVFEGTNRGRF